MDSLNGKTFLITGVSNRKSVATSVAKVLMDHKADVVFIVQKEEQKTRMEKIFPDSSFYICDVENEEELVRVSSQINKSWQLSGLLHSIAFANYGETPVPFIETKTVDLLQAFHISCISLIRLCHLLRPSFLDDAAVATVSIADTKVESYGYMAPVKAALESTVALLAQSFARFSKIRVNAVCSGPLKTSASAGIPGYMENYLYAEELTLRKKALKTSEVAHTIAFLLSPWSSGINGTGILVDAGMSCNYFNKKLVQGYMDRL